MLFTADGLQQASHPAIRKYRASRITSQSVLDLCCGIGSDTFAFAAGERQTLGLDIDPVRIAIARHNADVMGVSARFEVADVRKSIPARLRLASLTIRGAAMRRAGEFTMSKLIVRRFRW